MQWTNAQNKIENDFRIGIFMFDYSIDKKNNNMPVSTPFFQGTNYPSSELNVYIQDGLNTIQDYSIPSSRIYEDKAISLLNLISNLNDYYGADMKLLADAKTYYKPYVDRKGGENVYNNIDDDGRVGVGQHALNTVKPRPHYENMLDTNMFTNSRFKNLVWGHEITEEASFFHPFNSSMSLPDNTNMIRTEVPPSNVAEALTYYKEKLSSHKASNQKLVLMEAYHYRAITRYSKDPEGKYTPRDYLKIMNKYDPMQVFFEGSYNRWSVNHWYKEAYRDMNKCGTSNFHYLGKFKSIDYARNYTDNIHKVITVSLSRPMDGKITWNPDTYHRYHADLEIENANWLWFQVYTSIIHGVDGIWFWNVRDCWDRNDSADVKLNKARANEDPARYLRKNFYYSYKEYLAPIIKEMRYLVNHNLLSTNDTSILFSKTTDKDINGILDRPGTYIVNGNHNGGWELLTYTRDNHQSEGFGLRYTIRSNGKETIMIISNPLGVPIENVMLDFGMIDHAGIQKAKGIHLMFKGQDEAQQAAYPYILSKSYKTDRISKFSFDTPIEKVPYVDISADYDFNKKELQLGFAPLDVHVIRFVQ